MHKDAKALKERGQALFEKRRPLLSRWQDVGDHFAPEFADFTTIRSLGGEFASHLTTAAPVIIRRQLADAVGTMLRPRAVQWFHLRTRGHDRLDHGSKAWLEGAEKLMYRAMHDPDAQFNRATKAADNGFVTFGQWPMSAEMNFRTNSLLYRPWHLRDVCWAEDESGQIGEVYREWKPPLVEIDDRFKGKLHPRMEERLRNNKPHDCAHVFHAVIRAEQYGKRVGPQPWVSVWIDTEHDHILEEKGSWTRVYVIPRWMTLPGSQYAVSPATLAALPDARLVQAMTLTLLEAGEKAVNPPMVGPDTGIRGDLQLHAGGFTAYDADYIQYGDKLLRPLSPDSKALPFGVDAADRTLLMLREAFYLNALTMPQNGPEMTAYEVGQRVQEYIRNALPIFEPMEAEYNGALCEDTFELLMRYGAFGRDVPEALAGENVEFEFESPLTDVIEAKKGAVFREAVGLLTTVAQVDPSTLEVMDFGAALRDALEGVGVPTDWTKDPDAVAAAKAAADAQAAIQQTLAGVQQGADIAKTLGEANQGFAA